MFEEFWPDLGKMLAAGLLAGSASLAMQWAARKAARRLKQLRALPAVGLKTTEFVERRLAAILLGDVVGYSRLMNADEEGTHAGFLSCRREVMEPAVRGRPNAAKHLDEALRYILGHDGVWATTADDIAEYYLTNYYDQVKSWIAGRKARVAG